MPTFQSIGLHPELRKRVVSATALPGNDSTGAYRRVETPLALLSRHPTSMFLLDRQTEHAKPIGLSEVNQLRQEVAQALVAGSTSRKLQKRLRARAPHRDQPLGRTDTNWYIQIEGALSAFELVQDELTRKAKNVVPMLSTGCPDLNERLAFPQEYSCVGTNLNIDRTPRQVGVPFGYVTQLSGRSGSGKTQMALQIASSPGLYATWFLAPSASIVASLARRLSEWDDAPNTSNVLDRTCFITVQDDYQVLAQLGQLQDKLLSQESLSCWKPILLVLDSASGCLSAENETLLSTVALTLKRLARQFNIAVVVTNGSVLSQHAAQPRIPAMQDEALQTNFVPVARPWKPALGHRWLLAMDICVWLEAAGSKPPHIVHYATVDRHPARRLAPADPVGQPSSFTITRGGILPACAESE